MKLSGKRMELEVRIILSEITQSQENKCHMCSLICEP